MSSLFKKTDKNSNFKDIFKNSFSTISWYMVLTAVLTFLILVFVCMYFSWPESLNYEIGQKSKSNIVSKKYISFRDIDTESYLKKQIADNSVGYVLQENTLSEITSDIHTIFTIIREERLLGLKSYQDIDTLKYKISPYISDKISGTTLYYLLTISETDLYKAENLSVETNTFILEKNLAEDVVSMRKSYFAAQNYINSKTQNKEIIFICQDIFKNTVKPNLVYSVTETEKIKKENLAKIPEIYRTLEPGDIILSKGEIITPEKERLLAKCGFIKTNSVFYKEMCGIVLLIIFSFLYVFTFLRKYNIFISNFQNILLLSVIISVCSLGFVATGTVFWGEIDNYRLGYIAVMWVVVTVMLIYNLVSKYLSLFILTFLSVLCGLLLGKDIRIVAVSLLIGLVAIWAVSKIKARIELINTYLIILVITVIQIFTVGLINNDSFEIIFYEHIKFGVFSIPTSVLIFFIISGILERLFNLTTDMRLMELTSADNALLKNLLLKAPGTYTHSISVSYIAEACAETIGANVLLTKAGAYFHDIGKINNPEYFIENQYSENIHNEITPQLSVMVIRSHVKLGGEYAKKYKIPTKIIDIIKQHHGTSLVSYFYHKFSDNNTSLINVESQFRYEGPKPQSKEAAIIMIADSVEAASRSMQGPTPNKIETLVNSIVSGKLSDGQFSECPLTFSDISKIKLSCVKSLLHILHSRIEYPAGNTNNNTNTNK